MKELTLAQIAEACGGTLIGGNESKRIYRNRSRD